MVHSAPHSLILNFKSCFCWLNATVVTADTCWKAPLLVSYSTAYDKRACVPEFHIKSWASITYCMFRLCLLLSCGLIWCGKKEPQWLARLDFIRLTFFNYFEILLYPCHAASPITGSNTTGWRRSEEIQLTLCVYIGTFSHCVIRSLWATRRVAKEHSTTLLRTV